MPIQVIELSGQNITDYPVNMTIDTLFLIQQNYTNENCSDIRFTWLNKTSGLEHEIPFVIEGCGTNETNIWIKVPYVEANGEENIYMYFGNPDAEPVSYTMNDIFIFYEDFDDQDVSDWECYYYRECSPSKCYFRPEIKDGLKTAHIHVCGAPGVLECEKPLNENITAGQAVLVVKAYQSCSYSNCANGGSDLGFSYPGTPGWAVGVTSIITNDVGVRVWREAVRTINNDINADQLVFQVKGTSWPGCIDTYFDYIYIRKKVSPEPQVVIGSVEEYVPPTPPTPAPTPLSTQTIAIALIVIAAFFYLTKEK